VYFLLSLYCIYYNRIMIFCFVVVLCKLSEDQYLYRNHDISADGLQYLAFNTQLDARIFKTDSLA